MADGTRTTYGLAADIDDPVMDRDTKATLEKIVRGKDAVKRENRIEALRAASRIVAGIFASGVQPKSSVGKHEPMDADKATFYLAEQFAAWLETGER